MEKTVIELRKDLVPVYLNNVLIFNLDEKTSSCSGWQEAKILVCPSCLKSTTLGRDNDDEKFCYDPERAYLGYYGLKIKNETGFRHHVALCKPLFAGDGVWRVITKKQEDVALRFARFSRHETQWDFAQLNSIMLRKGAKVFVFCESGILKGYVVFDRVKLKERKVLYVLCDLFVFSAFRKLGIATKLVDYGNMFLNIDRDSLGVSFPVLDAARNIVLRAAGEYIITSSGQKISKKELVEAWK